MVVMLFSEEILLLAGFSVFREFFDKVKTEFSSILEDSKVNMNDLGLSLRHLFYLPFERPRQHQKLLGCIASHYPVARDSSWIISWIICFDFFVADSV